MLEIYRDHSEVDATNKDPVDILQEIGEKLHQQIEKLAAYEGLEELKKQEKMQRQKFNQERRDKALQLQGEMNEQKKQEYAERQKRPYKKWGKNVLQRSAKPQVKVAKVRVDIDQDEQDMRTYVGDLQKMVEQQEAQLLQQGLATQATRK